MSNRQACALVGVNERTGREWRHGRPDGRKKRPRVPADAAGPVALSRSGRSIEVRGSSRYLGEDERVHIADRWRERASIRTIAQELGRAPSTVSREIRRNGMPLRGDARRWSYRPHSAHRRAKTRRKRPKPRKIHTTPQLRAVIQDGLNRKWSPEQIATMLRQDYPYDQEMHVVHETIYQALYVQGRGELRRELAKALRTGRAIRKPHRKPDQRLPRFTHPMLMISQRPAEVADRAVPGHWEGDLIIGRDSGSAIGTLVERSTRYVMLMHLSGSRDAVAVRDALIRTMRRVPEHLTRSLTWDQGVEMGLHREFSLATGIPVYFCDPHSPWQRGSNENTNGLLRQYFPKGTDLSIHSREHLDAVAAELNGRPRKTLGWKTPAERLATLLTNTN
ncbi:IS30 family transposase [Saccharopolyspora sp. CA-218241]|uniref:IS30 family transposase n=1 Tax=Saccharopolyspora sp. CA-218241 TaxID=3240027 RepID=UPI003D95F6E4